MVLETNNLSVEYEAEDGNIQAVESVDIKVEDGETLGVIGESGCGKTTLIQAILRLLPDNGRVNQGEVLFKDENILEMTEKEFSSDIRWKEISYIPQTALDALDPLETVFDQYRRLLRTHGRKGDDIREQAEDAFDSVGLDPKNLDRYPHELSGGMKQRVMIAFAFALDPSVIIADEPTTALDVVIQDQVLATLNEIQAEHNSSLVLITHDLSVIVENCDKVAVMYAGDIVEFGDTQDVFRDPCHPYTMGLKNSIPDIYEFGAEGVTIPGKPPQLTGEFSGCKFRDRCPFAVEECQEDVPLEPVGDNRLSRCVRTEDIPMMRSEAEKPEVWKDD